MIPAFPSRIENEHGVSFFEPGMNLRDWFAGQALAMTIAAYVNLPESADLLARRCYMIADAMLAERERAR
jgi:hypothetical protein